MLELMKIISLIFVFLIGCGGLLWLVLYIWDKAFTRLLVMFQVKQEFLKFIIEKRKKNKKVFTPSIRKEEK
jgi:hypothetical protein